MSLLVSSAALACALPSGGVRAEASPDFLSRALARSSECDASWGIIVQRSGAGAASVSSGAVDLTRARRGATDRPDAGSGLSHRIIESTSFIHTVAGNREFLPRSTRERNDAWRGVSSLKSPADGRLSMPYGSRRQLNSSARIRSSIRSRSDSISRPKLDSFGRRAALGRYRSSAVAHPAYRCTRPRIL